MKCPEHKAYDKYKYLSNFNKNKKQIQQFSPMLILYIVGLP